MTDYDDLFAETAPEASVFAEKRALDPLAEPDEIVARDTQQAQLARLLNGVHEGYLPTTVSIYGPPGTGKTLTTRRVCREFAARTAAFEFEYVNLKECRSLFSAANEILFELTGEKLGAYQGLDGVFEGIWEALEEEVLGDLSPAERCQLVIEGVAAGKDDWVQRLRDTAPIVACRATDPDYTERAEWAHRLLQQAIYDLHTTSLQFDLINQIQWSRIIADARADEEPTDEDLESAAERATHLRELIVDLYSAYQANRRFATEVLGVGFETWAHLHPNGVRVLERVEDQLSDDIELNLAEEHLEGKDLEAENEDDGYPLLESVTASRYDVMVETWEKAVE